METLSKKQIADRAYYAKHKEKITAQKRAAYIPVSKAKRVSPVRAISSSTTIARKPRKPRAIVVKTNPASRPISARERAENLRADIELAAELSGTYF